MLRENSKSHKSTLRRIESTLKELQAQRQIRVDIKNGNGKILNREDSS